ncbi:alpha/beta hydrolase [Hoeflea sp. CAU 1731]
MRAQVLHDTPDNPAPKNAISGYMQAHDGKQIRYAIFRSDATLAKGTVILLQGRNENIEKYYETIRELTAHGLWVATFDWRGQGGSERLLSNPLPGYVRRFSDYVRDLEQFIETIVLPDGRLPFFMIGHSMGGLIALHAAPRLANRIEKLVVSAPFVALSHSHIGASTIRVLSTVMTLIGLGGVSTSGNRKINQTFEDNALTHDRNRFLRNKAVYDAVPEMTLGGPSFRWLLECLKAMKQVHRPEHLANIRIPTLMLAAGGDSIVPIDEIEDLATHFRAGELVTIDRARHELFQEADRYRNQVMAAVKAFVPGGDEPASTDE